MAVDGWVFNMTGWMDRHPGGGSALAPYLGGDGTLAASNTHSYINVKAALKTRIVGKLV